MRLTLLAALLACSATAAPASGAKQKLPNPGFRSIGIWNPQTSFRMDVAVWYPSPRASRDVHLDGWVIRVSKDYAASPGKYPVILISHDAAGSRLSSHDLAAYLARHGFIVIAPTHPGDNDKDTRALFHAHNFALRPRHLIAALQSAAKNPVVGPLMDRNRIGLLGVGFGASTVLQLARVAPDLSRLGNYCGPSASLEPLCSSWAARYHPIMAQEFSTLTTEHGLDYFTPPVLFAAEQHKRFPGVSKEMRPAVTGDAGTEPPTNLPGDAASQLAEPLPSLPTPVRAIGLMTPGLISLFPEESLRKLTLPVGILAAENDVIYPAPENAEKLLALLPQRPAFRVLQNANHYDLQPPCPPIHKDTFTALCGNPGKFAADNRTIRNEFFVRFFQKALNSPVKPPHTQSGTQTAP